MNAFRVRAVPTELSCTARAAAASAAAVVCGRVAIRAPTVVVRIVSGGHLINYNCNTLCGQFCAASLDSALMECSNRIAAKPNG